VSSGKNWESGKGRTSTTKWFNKTREQCAGVLREGLKKMQGQNDAKGNLFGQRIAKAGAWGGKGKKSRSNTEGR